MVYFAILYIYGSSFDAGEFSFGNHLFSCLCHRVIFTAFAISEQIEWNRFQKIYGDVMLVISVISLVLYLAVNVAKIQIPFLMNALLEPSRIQAIIYLRIGRFTA